MIQRIQTLYLLGALILIVLCFFLPVADISLPGGDLFTFNLTGYHIVQGITTNSTQQNTPLLFTGLFICTLYLTTIFLYKNRIIQMRFCIYNIILPIILTIYFIYVLLSIKKNLNAAIYYQIGIIFPIISTILTIMAFRAIKKDEKLVKSYDRLR